jgi:hypothetical protein
MSFRFHDCQYPLNQCFRLLYKTSPNIPKGLGKIARSVGQQCLCIITGGMVPLATTHGMLVLPGLGNHESDKSGKLIYFDSKGLPLLLGTPFFRPDGQAHGQECRGVPY